MSDAIDWSDTKQLRDALDEQVGRQNAVGMIHDAYCYVREGINDKRLWDRSDPPHDYTSAEYRAVWVLALRDMLDSLTSEEDE